jgi:acetylornithine deacetylase
VWAEIMTKGRAAHGSRWDLGISAIARMAKIITALEEFDQQELRNRKHPLVGPASQHCSLVRGGSGLSTYAEECTLQLERRTLPGETPEQVLEELKGVIRSTGEHAEVRLLLHQPPLSCEADSRIVSSLREAIIAVTGHAPEVAGVSYWMDAAIFAAAGIPTVNYGPSGAGAHAAVEWVDLDSVVTCAQVLFRTAWNFCAR